MSQANAPSVAKLPPANLSAVQWRQIAALRARASTKWRRPRGIVFPLTGEARGEERDGERCTCSSPAPSPVEFALGSHSCLQSSSRSSASPLRWLFVTGVKVSFAFGSVDNRNDMLENFSIKL